MDYARTAKVRPRRELIMRVLEPLSRLVVRVAAPLGVDPLWLVTLHGICGIVAAGLIAVTDGPGPGWWGAAALLLARAVLDNADGGLARVSGRVTRMGRYYDTGVDALVNVALFAALATTVGPWWAGAAWAALTLALSLDHNMERLYRIPRTVRDDGPPAPEPPPGAPAPLLALFEGLYRAVFAPQDRLIERLDRRLFARLEGTPYDAAPLDRRLAWSDLFSLATVTDLGLSTQTVLLALLLLAGLPQAYPPLVLAMLAWALLAQGLRVVRYRDYRRSEREDPHARS